MVRTTLCLTLPVGLALLCLAAPARPRQPQDEKASLQAVYASEIQPALRQYCGACHGKNNPQAGIDVVSVASVKELQKNQKIWRSIVRQIKDRTMPPAGMPQPRPAEHDRLVLWLSSALDAAEDSLFPKDPGRVVLHRLNRDEYNNTVRDLFGVKIRPADSFPADGGGGAGFDNNADTLYIPPVLLERCLQAAGDVLDAAPKERLFFVSPGPKLPARAAAKKLLAFHGGRAWRRPLTDAETAKLLALYDKAIARKSTHNDAVKFALKAALVSPNFLFRVEKEHPTPGAQPLDDYELASRLSYFLWSSMPDEELFRLAREQRLRQPVTLTAQVRRMLASPKAKALSRNFVGQWLRTRELSTTAQPDPEKFPEFTPSLRDAMQEEVSLFFQDLLNRRGSLLRLLDADYAFLNEELAKHYGVGGVSGPQFRKTPLSDGGRRGGLLGMGAVHVLTSYPQRTSPVLRGKWILSELLGTPPPPPPPVVATLSTNDAPEGGLTLRQRLEKHREKPECAGCHARMDPLGFGLENFDALGRWREKIADVAVDASGTLPSGAKFSGPKELKAQLLTRKDDFVRNVSEKMLAYALGRGLEPEDLPALRKITAAVQKDGYSAATLVEEVARSYPFQYRRSEGKPGAAR